MTTLRVLLVWPSSLNEVLGWGSLGAIAEPLALEYLAAAVKQMGHDAKILDLRLHPNDLAQVVNEYQPDLLGVTAYSMHVRRALAICAEVKALVPSCRTVIGGHHATFLPEDFFEPCVDWIVSGEGCGAIQELLGAMASGHPVSPQPGLWSRDKQGSFVPPIIALASSNNQLDGMPTPDRTLVLEDRQHYFIDWMRPVALLRTTLGCPYRCTFCSIWKVMEGRYLTRDIDAVVEELATIKEEWVFLVDDEAFINNQRMIALATAIKQAGLRKRFFTYCRIDTLLKNREAVAAWREIGLERLFIGIDAID
ncbi:MAG: cobalamin-dependent protein, partial [Undibacterium sp.]|nr:cobalamin-dependent protein [Undibacterium sp.]